MSHLRTWIALPLLALATADLSAAAARIHKVLPHYLDHQGRHTLAPSLLERDAYQAHLRQHPQERSGVRFDVHWKAPGIKGKSLTLRLELRSSKGDAAKPLVLETTGEAPRYFGKWSPFTLKGEDYEKFGDLVAWRATLWDGDALIGEQKSFLW